MASAPVPVGFREIRQPPHQGAEQVARHAVRRLLQAVGDVRREAVLRVLLPQPHPRREMRGRHALQGPMALLHVAAVAPRAQRHRGPEIHHPREVRRPPVPQRLFEDGAEQRMGAHVRVEPVDQRGDGVVVQRGRREGVGRRGLFGHGEVGIVLHGADRRAAGWLAGGQRQPHAPAPAPAPQPWGAAAVPSKRGNSTLFSRWMCSTRSSRNCSSPA